MANRVTPASLSMTDPANREWVPLSGVWIPRGAVIGRYTSGPNAGYCDNMGASALLEVLGVASVNTGAVPALHTIASAAATVAWESIIALQFTGAPPTTADRGRLVYGVDNQTGNLSSNGGAYLPIGQLWEVDTDAGTVYRVGVGPGYVAKATAAALALAMAAGLVSTSPVQPDTWVAPAAPSTTGLHAATASSVAVQTLLTADLVSGGKTALATYARNVTFTTAGVTATQAPDTATIVGLDINGNALSETVSGLSAGAATYQGIKAFASITSITYGAGTGTAATVAVGFGQKFGLSKPIAQAVGGPWVLQEISSTSYPGGVLTTGTVVSAATSAPNGTYAPAANPNGTLGFALAYVHT